MDRSLESLDHTAQQIIFNRALHQCPEVATYRLQQDFGIFKLAVFTRRFCILIPLIHECVQGGFDVALREWNGGWLSGPPVRRADTHHIGLDGLLLGKMPDRSQQGQAVSKDNDLFILRQLDQPLNHGLFIALVK
ncbi:hypothetical protein D3C71_1303200 [compost metagenome]